MKKLIAFGLALLAIAGCGGGGGGTGSVPGGAQVTAFATDSFTDDFDHVWVKLYKVELVGDTKRFTVFDDAAGRDVDLKTLRDASGPKFSFLDSNTVDAGTYKQVDVSLDKTATLFAKGSTTGVTRQFDDRFNDATDPTKSRLVMNAPGLVVAGKVNIVVDFDLATWLIQPNGRINAFLKRGLGTGLDDHGRHVDDDFGGRVSGLTGTAPNFTFTLVRGNGRNFNVRTDSNTRIFNENGAANPQLADNQKVEVSGALVAGVFLASSIRVEGNGNGTGEDPHKIKGGTSNLDETGGTFDIAVALARGFTPVSTTYKVRTSATTRFMSDTGAVLTKAEFYALLTSARKAEVEGTANADATFDAVKVKVENENDRNEAELTGPITATSASGFTMTVQRWEGVSLSGGESITVNLTGTTQFRLGNNFVTRTVFFATIGVGSKVEVKGALSGTTLTAIRVKDED